MPHLKISVSFVAILVTAAASAQMDIHNQTRAAAYNPAVDERIADFADVGAWEHAGRETNLVSVSESHPFDPPINIATAMSHFTQPVYEDATLRAMSFVLSDYSGNGGNQGYSASTNFVLHQHLEVDLTQVIPGFNITFKLAVPMHGLMAARGGANGNGIADASMDVTARDAQGGLLDEVAGDLHVEGTGNNEFNYSAGGDWAHDVHNASVDLPTGDQPRSAAGVELNSYHLLDLGVLVTGTSTNFDISNSLTTSASIPSPTGLFALSDFSGTGHMTFLAFDQAGNPFHDFSVYPTPVPEPASLVGISLGLVALARRRRK